jgi:ABC-type lipoprotein release transport system permease subunit
VQRALQTAWGEAYRIENRDERNASFYRLIRYEKWGIFFIALLVLVIASFSVVGALSMLIIEKRGDIETLRSLGAHDKLIRRIFVLEGWMISLTGLAAGLVLGIGFALLQQQFGFIKMPGQFIVQAYPVILSWTDILLTVIGVAAIGYIIALLPVASFYRKEK